MNEYEKTIKQSHNNCYSGTTPKTHLGADYPHRILGEQSPLFSYIVITLPNLPTYIHKISWLGQDTQSLFNEAFIHYREYCQRGIKYILDSYMVEFHEEYIYPLIDVDSRIYGNLEIFESVLCQELEYLFAKLVEYRIFTEHNQVLSEIMLDKIIDGSDLVIKYRKTPMG